MANRTVGAPWTAGAAATAFLLPVAYSPSVSATFWSPKAAVLLVAGGVGLAAVPRLLRTPCRRPLLAGLAFVGVAALSTLVAHRPVEALVGPYNAGTGFVFVACLLGVYALGAAAVDGERTVVAAALAGTGASAAVGLLQALVTLPLPALEAEDGRVVGLAGNAVHLGGAALVALVLVAWLASEHRAWIAAAVPLGAAIQLSGTRSALAVAVLAVGVVGWRRARRLLPALLVALAVGVLAGNWLADHGELRTATERASAGGGLTVRAEVWAYSRHAFLERPALGHGPGRFLAATAADRTRSVAKAEGPTKLHADAHDLAVEYSVTTGLLGLAALGWWLLEAARRARGPLLAAGAVILALALVQPQSVGTTPLLLLFVGAAGAPVALPAARRRDGVAVAALGCVAGLTALALLVGDVSLKQTRDTFELDAGRRADRLLRPWPQPASTVADAYAFRAIDSPPGPERERFRALVRQWRARAVDRYPADPALWVELADEERFDGLTVAADRHYRKALARNAFDVRAMVGLAELRLSSGDIDGALGWFEQALALQDSDVLRDVVDDLRDR